MKYLLFTLLFSLLISASGLAQSPYGYMGKRTYITADLSGSLRLLAFNEEGQLARPLVNIIPKVSFRHVYNKRNEIAIAYRYYQDIATLTYNGTGFWGFSSYNAELDSLDRQAFTTHEIALEHYWYRSGTNAPLGRYFGVSLGAAFSSYKDSVRISNTDDLSGSNPELIDTVFNLAAPVISPMLRLHFGNRQLLSDKIFVQYGMSLGLNLAYIGDAIIYDSAFNLISLELSKDVDENDPGRYENMAKRGIQHRVFYKNLLAFKLGIGFLL